MFNVGSGELAVIAVVALLVLGPKRLPELARGLGKFIREFRRQTDEVRTVVEREFYRMDQDVPLDGSTPTIRPAGGLAQGMSAEDFVSKAAARVMAAPTTPAASAPPAPEASAPLVVQSEPSQVTKGLEKPEAPAPVADTTPPKTDA